LYIINYKVYTERRPKYFVDVRQVLFGTGVGAPKALIGTSVVKPEELLFIHSQTYT